MTTPTTPAGRALLATWRRTGDFHTRAIVEDAIPAIEAEAAAAARTALLDELETVTRALVEHAPCVSMDSGSTVDRTDVLAEINRRRP